MSKSPYDDLPPPYTPYPTQPQAPQRQVPPYPPAVPSGFPQPYQPRQSYLESPLSDTTSYSSSDRSPDGYYSDGRLYDHHCLGGHLRQDSAPSTYQPFPQQTIILKERRRDSESENTCLLTLLFAMCCCCLCVD